MYSQAQNEKDKVKEKIKGFSCDLPSREGKKEYTDMLEYCGKYIYQDVMSVKSLLRMGVCDKKHRISDPNGHAEWAFVGKKEGEGRKEVKHINRRTKEKFDKEDWLLIASALVEMPDHIWVTQEDVDEYEKKLLENLKEEMETTDKERWENLDKEQLVKEFLMALGYCKNDAIIRRQCEIFGEDLPRIIQYILYERAYKELGGKVRFKGEDEKIHATCENKYELEKHYEEFLKRFGICADSMVKELTPVEDVIYDYRPYLKAVPYYQGIKPEFLCRMANSIVQGRKDAAATKRVIDAFGGSGACTMNGFYKEMKPEQVYNDLGIMNTAFYRCLKDEKKFKSLKKKVDKIIEKAFSDYDEDGKMGSFFSRFEKYLDYREKAANTLEKKKIANAKEMLEKSIKECEEAYVEDYGKKVSKCRSGKKEEELESYNAVWLENRLGAMHENYAKKLKMDEAGIENYKAVFRSIERYMHVFMLKLNALYLVLVGEVDIKVTKKWEIEDTDLAMLFLMYNSLTHRHFYNHCTIENIGKFMNSYQAGLEYGKEVFKSERVEVNQKNAIELLGDSKYNEENTVWYLDIPYAETSSADYVPDWFAIENFFERLSGCKGTYIVSSRCNICLPEEVKEQYSNCQLKKKQFDEEEDDNKELEGCIQKEWNVFTFYYSFLSEDDVKEYQDYFSEIKKENMVKELRHLPEDKKAKYILIPYTKMQEDYFVEDDADKAQTYSLEKNNSKATAEYVRRMLAATHNSNIPVEVMITNAELDFAAMHAQKAAIHVQETETGIYVMPTFKMGADGSQYMVEPLVIIMDYKKFMEQMLRLLYHEEWKKYQSDRDAAAAAQYFYKYFKKK